MVAAGKRKRSRALLIGLAAFLLWAVGAAIVVTTVVMRPPDFSASPLSSRDNPRFENSSRVGLLEELSLAPQSGRPASEPFVKPVRIDGDDTSFVLHWKGEEEIDVETLPDRMSPEILGDDEIELFAFATWLPEPQDEISAVEVFDPDQDKTTTEVSNGDWKVPLTFRDPATLEDFSDEQLDELNIPKAFRQAIPPERYMTGIIRLLFRTRNMDAVRFVGGEGGDSVTGASVTYSLDSLENEPDQASVGEWAHYDFAFLLWHDKALTFHVQVLTGEPIYKDLPQQLGEQVAFGDFVRLQWLAREPGAFDSRFTEAFTPKAGADRSLLTDIAKPFENDSIISWNSESAIGSPPASPVDFSPDQTDITLSETGVAEQAGGTIHGESIEARDNEVDANETGKTPARFRISSDFAAHLGSRVASSGTTDPETYFRFSNNVYHDHLGRVEDDGSITWDFSGEGHHEQIRFASCKHTKVATSPLRLVFLPKMTELTFEIAGTPDVPNPRHIEDLFDQKIPRLTLTGDDPDDAEGELLEFIGVATQTGIEHSDVWDNGWPESFPRDHTFRDTTPQQLLNWYLTTSHEAFIEQDTDDHLLMVNQDEDSWWTRLIDFILQR